METDENQDISLYLKALRNAKTDNEKIAALLMVAKKTKHDSGDIEVKRQILDAVGGKFFSRLLKTKKVPDDCPPNIYKSVALSVLSALCNDPEMANSPELTENLSSFNEIILMNPGEEDKEDQQLVDNTYDCYNSLCRHLPGLEALIQARSIGTFCEVVITQSYGYEKAHDLICWLVSCFGPETWEQCEASYHHYLLFLGKQFLEDESLHKFEMCKTLDFLLNAAPNDKDKTLEPPWIQPIVRGLDLILRSKISSEQREPALKLASTMVQVCGIYSVQPPYAQDYKLFLLTTHLCCVEVRMVLEGPDISEVNQKGRLLSACYAFLENVINHLTSGPPLDLDERQVMQLHSAMVGAFGAIIHFLKRVSDDTNIQWNSILLATVRVLGAWLAEETSALRQEIYDLIPFLVQVSKLCIPPEKKQPATNGEIAGSSEQSVDAKSQNHEQPKADGLSIHMDKLSCTETENKSGAGKSESKPDEPQSVSSEQKPLVNGNSQENDKDKSAEQNCDSEANSKEKCDSEKTNEQKNLNENHISDPSDVSKQDKNTSQELSQSKTSTIEKMETDPSVLERKEARVDAHLEKDVLSEEELVELHLKADILHYLLPGLCHLTAEEEPRHALLNSGALGMLDLYMWRNWERLVDQTHRTRETMSCLVILCNIFLNLIIVEPDMIPNNPEFSHILLLVAKGIHVVESEPDYIVLWAHLITLGLMLMRSLHKTTEECLEEESVSRFFLSSIKFLSGAYMAKHKKKGAAVLDITDTYKMAWDQISQTWFLSMQAFAACIPLHGELPNIIMKSGWIPSLLKVIGDVKANTVAEETKSCFQLLLTTVARENKTARALIKEKGKDNLARFFKSRELTDTLNAS